MPANLKQLSREAYCSAPPLLSTSLRPPQLTRETEGRPRAPLRAPIGKQEVKAEISSIESVEFVKDEPVDVQPDVRNIPWDPRQVSDPLQVGLAALAIRALSSNSSAEEGAAAAPGPSGHQEPRGLRWQSNGRIPQGDLGPADPPRKRGQPKGSKSRPRVAFAVDTLPERQEKLRAEERLSKMSSR